jgi:hypothetical protein
MVSPLWLVCPAAAYGAGGELVGESKKLVRVWPFACHLAGQSGIVVVTRQDTPKGKAMNVRVGTSKTVHNAAAVRTVRGEQLADGTRAVHQIPVPSCNVATIGKALNYTDDAVTCKTCAKRAS